MRRILPVLVLAAIGLGCRGRPPARLVVGPYSASSAAELWERTLAAVRRADYEPEQADPARGQIVVTSRLYGSRERFFIQLYREGWVQVRVETQRGYFRLHMPADLVEEQMALTMALRRHLEPEPPASGELAAPASSGAEEPSS